MSNPAIEELQNNDKFELVTQLNHEQIKAFVMEQLTEGGKIIYFYMIYQLVMILIGMFFLTRGIVLAFQNNPSPLVISLLTLACCFSLLIIIHEGIHGIALKLTGAPKVRYGGYLKKFIFYAEADKHVLNRSQFAFVALAPLAAIQVITLTGILFNSHQSGTYFWAILMSAHSLFCAGDIGLLSFLYRHKNSEIYTFDIKDEKTSYYYRKKNNRF